MQVLHVMASGERGGGADHLASLMPELVRLGVTCGALVSPEGPLADRLESLGIRVERLAMMRSRLDLRVALRLARLVGRIAPDLIHCHGTRAAFFAALARHGVPLVYTIHGLAYRQSVGLVRRGALIAAEALACSTAAEVLSVSSADLADLKRRHLLAPRRGVHISNAVDVKRFAPGDQRQARARLGLPADGVLVGTVSRLVPQKSVADLIDAVLPNDGLGLVIVGDGPERSALERRAQRGGDRIRFLGGRDDVPEVLRSLDIFALSSRWEGEPIALLEAMATGLACVATRTSGAVEVLADAATGVLVEVGRPEAMASALTTLAQDSQARQAMGARARAHVSTRTWAGAAARVLEVYRAVQTRRF